MNPPLPPLEPEVFATGPDGAREPLPLEGWGVSLETRADEENLFHNARFTWQGGGKQGPANHPECCAGLAWRFTGWTPDVYILLPAGAYNGNRFPSLRVPYSPRVPEDLLRGADTPPYITDVPRLGPGSPRLQLKSGDLAFPAFGWFHPATGRAWFAWAADPAAAAEWLWEVDESEPGAAVFRVLTPCVRQSPVYRLPMMQRPTPDRGWQPAPGEAKTLALKSRAWPCGGMAAFLDTILSIRASLAPAKPLRPDLPFSAAAALIEDHYNRDSWRPALGVYATDCGAQAPFTFQTGWCGGVISTLPLLAAGQPETRARARQTLETFFRHAPAPNGLFYGKMRPDGAWCADYAHDTARPYTHQWTLVRRQADALHYLLRQVALLERLDPDRATPPLWDDILRRAAAAFAGLWRREGQFGQFIHQQTGEILVGGSASGALVPAALINAWRRYREPAFLETACDAAEFFAREFLARGFTTGGPGDALQNPDSESAAALVESFAELHAVTGDTRWVRYGREAAALLATWVMPYDFPFPPGTEFHRLGIRSRGSVFANTQNKHAAPGICTHAGAGLFHLARVTRDRRLLDLIRDIARFIPQCVSRPGRPVRAPDGRALPPGWINERVNTSDWDENIGGVFHGSTWCEVAMLLTALELPGVYVPPGGAEAVVFDHIEARVENNTLLLRNPTPFPATVRLFFDQDQPRDPFWFLSAPALSIQPGPAFIRLPVPRPGVQSGAPVSDFN